MHFVADADVFLLAPDSFTIESYQAERRAHDSLVFAEADRVHAAEAQLMPGTPGMTDLYFVGAAGWASQDVFGRELTAARDLFDDRFGTRGRSIVLANDASTRDSRPLAGTITLRHALNAVGERMNREEDVLFLFVTSHGSQEGIALSFPHGAPFDRQTLSPQELRSMLVEAGIKWRVLVISGCESGVFIGPLQDDFTLIATAAAGRSELVRLRDRQCLYGLRRGRLRQRAPVVSAPSPRAFANAAVAIRQGRARRRAPAFTSPARGRVGDPRKAPRARTARLVPMKKRPSVRCAQTASSSRFRAFLGPLVFSDDQ